MIKSLLSTRAHVGMSEVNYALKHGWTAEAISGDGFDQPFIFTITRPPIYTRISAAVRRFVRGITQNH
jgi:hypothetical protein